MVPVDSGTGKQTMAEFSPHFCLTGMGSLNMARRKSTELSAKEKSRAVQLVSSRQHEYFSFWSALEAVASEIGCQPRELELWVKSARPDLSDMVTSMRGTALCRGWMREVLQTDLNDLSKEAVERVMQHPETPAKDGRTWLSWCTTGGPKQRNTRDAFPGIHKRWFDSPELGLLNRPGFRGGSNTGEWSHEEVRKVFT